MKTRSYRNIIPTILITLGLGWLSLASAVEAGDPSIVGLWRVHYFSGGSELFQSFDQWHADGLEFEVASIFGALCQGSFKTLADGTVHLFHTGWNYDASGNLTGYFNERQILRVGSGGQGYSGTWDIKNYDLNGSFLSEQKGTLRATRLTVNSPL